MKRCRACAEPAPCQRCVAIDVSALVQPPEESWPMIIAAWVIGLPALFAFLTYIGSIR